MRARELLLGLATLAACSGSGVTKLPGAVRADIPVFEPSTVEAIREVAFSTGDDFDSIQNFVARSWRLSTQRPLAEVVAFYQQVGAVEVEAPVVDAADGEIPFVEVRVVEETDWEVPQPAPVPDEVGYGAPGEGEGESENVDHVTAADGNGSGDEFAGMPCRVFRLPEQDGSAVEVAIYLQPRQRLYWFAITETVPVAN